MTVPRESKRYKLDLLGVQVVRWVKGDPVSASDFLVPILKRKLKSSA
jgi:hypothetical protein